MEVYFSPAGLFAGGLPQPTAHSATPLGRRSPCGCKRSSPPWGGIRRTIQSYRVFMTRLRVAIVVGITAIVGAALAFVMISGARDRAQLCDGAAAFLSGPASP